MSELLIIRHAKSSWADASLSDYDRPLNARGERDAPRMGRWLVEQDAVPDLILSSTAQRARETTDLLAPECNCNNIEWYDNLYHAPAEVCMRQVMRADTSFERVAVVAHNPGLEILVSHLGGQEIRMPTAAIAHFGVTGDWAELQPALCQLLDVWRPKELPTEFE